MSDITTKHAGGRPLKYTKLSEVESSIEQYFRDTPQMEWTVTGLALAAGFVTRQSLLEYSEREEFGDAIRRAKLKVEQSYELGLRRRGNAGDIFGLKNFNWKDKTETESTVVADVTSNGETISDPTLTSNYLEHLKQQTKTQSGD